MSLDQITHEQLAPFAHGFFGRAGGASSGLFKGLNCGFGSSDQSEIVAINRARVANQLQAAPSALVTLYQTHSARTVEIDDAPQSPIEGDGLVTSTPGIVLGVLTADCAPVLFADPRAGVIGAAHAGWKGAIGGILDATIDRMERLGALRAHIRAVIGPTISQRAYEVGQEFYERFANENSDFAKFFTPNDQQKWQFDLPGFVQERLQHNGVQAFNTDLCTYSDAERFYSFRRSTHRGESDYGRLISTIRI